jgi:hypothetical protein
MYFGTSEVIEIILSTILGIKYTNTKTTIPITNKYVNATDTPLLSLKLLSKNFIKGFKQYAITRAYINGDNIEINPFINKKIVV